MFKKLFTYILDTLPIFNRHVPSLAVVKADEIKAQLKTEIPPPIPQNIITVTGDESLTPEEKVKLDSALAELSKLFGGNTFTSLEDFIKQNSGSSVIPFTSAENYSDVKYEIETHKISAEAYSDLDYIETLLSFHNQGYEFEGLEQLYRKAQAGTDLSKAERTQLEQWYVLVSMEQVYNV